MKPTLFVVQRPRPGKRRVRPVHPLGWLMLVAVPGIPLLSASAASAVFGRLAGLLVASVMLPLVMLLFFRLTDGFGEEEEG